MNIKYKLINGIDLFIGDFLVSSSAPLLKSTNEKLVLGPVPCIPEKSKKKRPLSSPVLTGYKAKRILEEQDRKKQERDKKTQKSVKLSDQEFSDCDEDYDDGYQQYMET